MGANLSGEYGGVLVHDTTDTVRFSPGRVPSLNVMRVKIFSLFAAILFGIVLVGQIDNAQRVAALVVLLLFAVVLGGLWILCQLPHTEYVTLLFRIPEKTYILERFSLIERPKSVHGNASELKEIMIGRITTDDYPAFWSGDEPIFTCWSPALAWRSKDKLRNVLSYPYTLGYFRYEQRAREFAEELASRLGIPVVDEPHPCQEIARRVSSQVQQARETLRNALSWLR